jgi:AraC-like DNA-binding protein
MKNIIKIQKILIIRIIKLLYNYDASQEVTEYVNFIFKLRKTNGLNFTIKYIKCVRNHITRYICKKPALINDSLVSLDKNGFPIKFLYLKELIDRGLYKIVLTILTYTRSIKPTKSEEQKIKPSFDSIIEDYKGINYTIPSSFIKEFVKDFNLTSEIPIYNNLQHFVSVKGSPNGPSSVSTL